MLEGLVAAGYYVVFYKRRQGAAAVGAGVAVLTLAGYLVPAFGPAAAVLSALWLMGAERWRQGGETQELFLSGGVWLMARSLAGIGTVRRAGEIGQAMADSGGTGLMAWIGERMGVQGLETALGTALFLMAALFLLGRGKIYPLWMAALAGLRMSGGFLGRMPYAEPWQGYTMDICLYLGPGAVLVWQQIVCIRQELRRMEAAAGELSGIGRGAGAAQTGYGETGLPRENWQEAAEGELWRLRIFEHDFRHHLDMVGALYENGSPEEAAAYIEDLKQSRLTHKGRRIGGEKELLYILMAKKQACRKAEICFSYQIAGCPGGIAWMDMSALVLNLLDNAIRACEKVQGPRNISIMLLSRGDLWQIELVNSAGKEKVEKAPGFPVHGIGMVSVRQIVEKYNGTYQMHRREGQVIQKIILAERDMAD